jgi:nucleoside-diphosphate-sugar epimerase
MTTSPVLPETIETEEQLEEVLSAPTPELIADLSRLEGDLLVLGAGGKMGPMLARLARRGLDASGSRQKVIGVSRFTSDAARQSLEAAGVDTIACDLLDRQSVEQLPQVPNVIFMAGRKFGSTGNEPLTWAMNTHVPALVAERYRGSRIVAFSTGNVYDLAPVVRGGSTEDMPTRPIGEYAQSCLGRERIFQYFSQRYETPAMLVRLNYAVELRYGILLDVGQKVATGTPVDLTMGNVNVIWQGDANAAVLRALHLAASPASILNLTGPEIVSIRAVATRVGDLLGVKPRFEGAEAPTALLSNASRAHALFGYPHVSLDQMIRWVAHWIAIGGALLDKPTHYEQRDGKF